MVARPVEGRYPLGRFGDERRDPLDELIARNTGQGRKPEKAGKKWVRDQKDRRTTDPTDEIQRRDLKGLITKGLTRAERLILILYYYEEMTMKEIGSTLDLSESRVSQMHSSIIMRLKAQMANKDKEFVPEEE